MTTDTHVIELARPEIAGLTLRSYRPGDAPAISALFNRVLEHDGVPWRGDEAEFENWFSTANEHFDPARDVFLAEVDGSLVASADGEWIDTTDGLREYRMGASVDPEWRRRGIGTWLQRLLEAHAAELAKTYSTDRPQFMGSWAGDSERDKVALITRFGFQPVRYFFDMARPTLDEIEEPALPEGVELRPVSDEQMKQFWDADVEAFRDHWGGFDGSEERFQQWLQDPKFDPSLFVVAWDGDEIAGGVVNEINTAENVAFKRQRGWLRSVFVRRPWRRRGLGKAVVLRSLQVLRDRGLTSAGLGVDADNPMGALGLYTGTGFEVEYRSTAYRKPMETAA
jgi:mycothiol synthase